MKEWPSLARGAGSGQARCPWREVQPPCRCSPVHQIYSPHPTYLQANSRWFLDMQQPGVLRMLLPQKHRKYPFPQKLSPSEMWDWTVYTGLHNTGSSLLSSTILAQTDGSPESFKAGALGAHTLTACCLKRGSLCLSWLVIISLKSVGLFQSQYFQTVSAGLTQSWQQQKSSGPYMYYTKLQQREERAKWISHGEKIYSKFFSLNCGSDLGLCWAAWGFGWPTNTGVAWTLLLNRSPRPWKNL